MNGPRQSLRARLLWPLLLVSIAASIGVAFASYWFAEQTAERELINHYQSISTTLKQSTFPLTRNVLQTVAMLTECELITAHFDGTVIESTLPSGDPSRLVELVNRSRLDGDDSGMIRIEYAGKHYRAGMFRRTAIAGSPQTAAWIIVLFDEGRLNAALTRAVVAPLATGLSTILLLTSITLVVTTRLIKRLTHLQNQVEQIAHGKFETLGEFQTTVVSGPQDEVGLLATAIDSMAKQLNQMWRTLHQREGERLLHQVAAGLAHNLRNSLTGARMAVELHQRKCAASEDKGLGIALHEIEQTESYVQRLLLVAAGKQDQDRPAKVIDCLNDVRSSLDATASHRSIAIVWKNDTKIEDSVVQDGASLVAAITNLVFNALQVAKHVEVCTQITTDHRLSVEIIDDGPGPSVEIYENLFEPFVTTKPEGLGLGLPLVRRAARRLGGDVDWRRDGSKTIFSLVVEIQ